MSISTVSISTVSISTVFNPSVDGCEAMPPSSDWDSSCRDLLLEEAASPSSASQPDLTPAFPALGSTLPATDLELPCQVGNALDLWFAEQGDDIEQAKAMCQACPLRAECLDGALRRREPWGVWGGEVLIDGVVVARKRGRGRPRKQAA